MCPSDPDGQHVSVGWFSQYAYHDIYSPTPYISPPEFISPPELISSIKRQTTYPAQRFKRLFSHGVVRRLSQYTTRAKSKFTPYARPAGPSAPELRWTRRSILRNDHADLSLTDAKASMDEETITQAVSAKQATREKSHLRLLMTVWEIEETECHKRLLDLLQQKNAWEYVAASNEARLFERFMTHRHANQLEDDFDFGVGTYEEELQAFIDHNFHDPNQLITKDKYSTDPFVNGAESDDDDEDWDKPRSEVSSDESGVKPSENRTVREHIWLIANDEYFLHPDSEHLPYTPKGQATIQHQLLTYGRRSPLLFTFPCMAICLLIAGFSFWGTSETGRVTGVSIRIYLFTIFYSPGEGPVPFIWYAAWCCLLWALILLFVHKTKGKTLEELDQVFTVPLGMHAAYGLRQIPYSIKIFVSFQNPTPEQLYEFESESEVSSTRGDKNAKSVSYHSNASNLKQYDMNRSRMI
ncbi:hypothetical protein EV424DRAFT_1566500 [Suillus variegatus]|nr:hypothetical protein EV424DRAFT_1566500 [Suillus variegatus]